LELIGEKKETSARERGFEGQDRGEGNYSRVLSEERKLVVRRDRDDESEFPSEIDLSDGGEEGSSASTGSGEVRVPDLLALPADELRKEEENAEGQRTTKDASRKRRETREDSHPEADTATSTSARNPPA